MTEVWAIGKVASIIRVNGGDVHSSMSENEGTGRVHHFFGGARRPVVECSLKR